MHGIAVDQVASSVGIAMIFRGFCMWASRKKTERFSVFETKQGKVLHVTELSKGFPCSQSLPVESPTIYLRLLFYIHPSGLRQTPPGDVETSFATRIQMP